MAGLMPEGDTRGGKGGGARSRPLESEGPLCFTGPLPVPQTHAPEHCRGQSGGRRARSGQAMSRRRPKDPLHPSRVRGGGEGEFTRAPPPPPPLERGCQTLFPGPHVMRGMGIVTPWIRSTGRAGRPLVSHDLLSPSSPDASATRDGPWGSLSPCQRKGGLARRGTAALTLLKMRSGPVPAGPHAQTAGGWHRNAFFLLPTALLSHGAPCPCPPPPHPGPHPQGCIRREGKGGRGSVCVPKKAQIHFSFCKVHLSHCEIRVKGEGRSLLQRLSALLINPPPLHCDGLE